MIDIAKELDKHAYGRGPDPLVNLVIRLGRERDAALAKAESYKTVAANCSCDRSESDIENRAQRILQEKKS